MTADSSAVVTSRRAGKLSKSRFCAGLQYLRQLWWRVHEPDAPELQPSPELQAVFEHGHRIGDAARAEFPRGVLVDRKPWEVAEKVADTQAALAADASAIFEASFVADGTFVAVDVLERLEHGFALVEVKSTYSVKPQFVPDVAIQVHVARACGVDVRRAEVMHLATGAGARGCQFVRRDVTAEVEQLLPAITGHLGRMELALAGTLPAPLPSTGCTVPYDCPFQRRCAPTLERSAVDF